MAQAVMRHRRATSTDTAEKLPVTSPWTASERTAVTLALTVALIGLALPYGTSTPGVDAGLTVLEWIVSALALLAAAGLIVDLLRPLYPRLKASGLGFLAAAFVWATAAVYTLLHGQELGWVYATSEALRAGGWAGLALFEWRRVAIPQQTPEAGS